MEFKIRNELFGEDMEMAVNLINLNVHKKKIRKCEIIRGETWAIQIN